MTAGFEGALLDVYSAIFEKAVTIDLAALSPEQFALMATVAIKDSLGGQVRYFSKVRQRTPLHLKGEEGTTTEKQCNQDGKCGSTAPDPSNSSSVDFKGVLLLIYRAIFEKVAISDLSNLSPEQFATISTDAIKDSLGGQVFYIPMGLESARHDRDMKICDAWEAGLATIGELAIRFEMSQQQIYSLLHRLSGKYRDSHSGIRQVRKERNAELLADRKAGATYRELGKKFGLTSNYVRKIVQKLTK